jgi:SAM-dependent methyltransferase
MPDLATPHPVTFNPALLEQATDASVKVWAGAVRAFARRLSPLARAEFLMGLDAALYEDHGTAAIAASQETGHGGLHPKHALTRYHDFFTQNIREGERVIDLGCGVGALAASIAEKSRAIVTGQDWQPGNLAKAKFNTGPLAVTLIEGDITKDRVPSAFDVVVLSNVLEHLNDRPQLLRQWQDWYSPSRYLIRVPAYDRDWRVPWKEQLDIEWRLDNTHMTEYTAQSLVDECHAAGLKLITLIARWGEYWTVAVPTDGLPEIPY